ncbi:MAG: VOC family protein [Deltaproteobacteria bacterium]|nr:VOC family protein [Deltaproteobacteria bacterium]
MASIVDIAQIGVTVADRAAWERFAADVLGFPTWRSDDGALTYCRIDGYHHRLALRDGAAGLAYVTYDVGDAAGLQAWREALSRKQVAWQPLAPAEAARRRVSAAIELCDPDGHRIALGHGFDVAPEPCRYTRPLSVLRLGHAALTVSDTARAHQFYTDVLGFRLSDWVHVSDAIRLCFLRVNARHHALALLPCGPGLAPRLQHAMVEVETLDDLMRSYHHARAVGAPIGMGPGKHPNCETLHCYVQTPGGFALEFGYGHRRVNDATHQPVIFPAGTPVDVWGGDVQSPEFILG